MRDFHTLDVWRKSHQFTLNLFQTTEAFPKTETFQLAATLRRGSMNITMRIAEACGYDTRQQFVDCLSRVRVTATETEYALLLARDLKLLSTEDHDDLLAQLVQVRRMVSGLMNKAPEDVL